MEGEVMHTVADINFVCVLESSHNMV